MLEENEDLRRSEIMDRVAGMGNSDASDEAVLGDVVRLLHDANPSWDWVGIYLLVGDTLVVGSHTGEYPEHSHIAVGEGVCGTAVAEGSNQVVADVRERENYLACSFGTRSEIVVLIREGKRIVGQFDVDSDEEEAFTEEDEALLAELAELLAPRCASLLAKAL